MSQAIVLSFLFLSFVLLTRHFRSKKAGLHRLPLLPGPKRWPFIGNIFNAPVTSPGATYKQWGQDCGSDIIQFQIFSQQFIIVNSKKIAVDLFEKRSKIYSDKPDIHILAMAGWDFAFVNLPYGSEWRAHRRLFHEAFREVAIGSYQSTILNGVHALLRDLLKAPDDVMEATKLLTASIVMGTVYGHKISDMNDRFVQNAEECIKALMVDLLPDAKAAFVFPSLRFFPSWFPGAGFKTTAKKCRSLITGMQNEPFESVKKDMEEGTAVSSVTSDLLERNKLMGGSEEQETIIKRVTATAYSAGSDTTNAVITTGILAMILYPDVQKRAQIEIDRVVGSQRLPDFGDRESLPYLEALLREIMRWHPVVPIPGWHCASEDDVYEGMFIPKGSYIAPNVWAMTRDEKLYPEPEVFRPERHLTADGRLNDDSVLMAFGFGRRICPGRFLANSTTWAAMASLLAVFQLDKPKDSTGENIDIKAAFTDGIISMPLPFQCSIKPRSKDALRLVQETD